LRLYRDARTVALMRNISNALTASNRLELEDVVGRQTFARAAAAQRDDDNGFGPPALAATWRQ